MNDDFDYIEEAHVTASGQFHVEKLPAGALEAVLSDYIAAANNLDKLKKSLFYGRECDGLDAIYRDSNYVDPQQVGDFFDFNTIHGIIGLATESGELVEALYGAMFEDKQIDMVNVFEEVGDGTWYMALLLRKAGRTFDDVFRNNIAKLRKRFKDKFAAFDANNRNLDAERIILEDGMR